MSEMRSSLEFRSNIYPTLTKGALYNDRKFLDAISDPEALSILWHHGGSQGSKLNPLQKKQHEKAMHCAYAEDGDYPWGTLVGTNSVVCLCERVECPLYSIECSRFHPKEYVPQKRTEGTDVRIVGSQTAQRNPVEHREPEVSLHSGITTMANYRPKPSTPHTPEEEKPAPQRRPSFSFVSSTLVEDRSRQEKRSSTRRMPEPTKIHASEPARIQRGQWSQKEDAVLREMYPTYGISVRKWTKRLPGRSVEEILDRAHELKVRYVPQREREAKRSKPRPRTSKPSGAQTKADKKRQREQMRRRPWDIKEDEILRENYPRYGANMVDWPQKLKYRTKASIETRARQLGL